MTLTVMISVIIADDANHAAIYGHTYTTDSSTGDVTQCMHIHVASWIAGCIIFVCCIIKLAIAKFC